MKTDPNLARSPFAELDPLAPTRRSRTPKRAPAPSTRQRPSRRLQERRERVTRLRAQGTWVEAAWHGMVAFGGVALLTSCLVSLAGNVVLESLRRTGIDTAKKISTENAMRRELKSSIAISTGPEALDRWALDHGLVASETAAPLSVAKPTLVARR